MTATTQPAVGHLSQLDALRGIAALTVVVNHFTVVGPLRWMWQTPLRFLFTGHDAVILFFVLSGFVLALHLTSNRNYTYRGYLIKRICRIYLPYIAVFSIACAAMSIVYRGPIQWAGAWANQSWDGNVTVSSIVSHIVFLGTYRADHFIPVIWSLIYEMRVSLIFPFVVIGVVRSRMSYAIATAMLFSAAAYLLLYLEGKNPSNANLRAPWELTAHYAGILTVGAVLAVHQARWRAWLITGTRKVLVLGLSLGFYFLSRLILHAAPGGVSDFLFDWGVTLGASGIICTALASVRMTAILRRRPFTALGAMSYSLYLTHSVVLLTVLHLMPSPDTAWIALGLAALLVFPFAALAWFLFERPAIAAGNMLMRYYRYRTDRYAAAK